MKELNRAVNPGGIKSKRPHVVSSTDLVGDKKKVVAKPPQAEPKVTKVLEVPKAPQKEEVVEAPESEAPVKVPKPEIQEVVHVRPKQVDIMMVVDASASMSKFLSNVKNTFKGFIPALAPLNWNMFFINTDHGDNFFLIDLGARKGRAFNLEMDGVLLKQQVLTQTMPGHEQIFLDTIGTHRPSNWLRSISRRGEHPLHDRRVRPYNACQSPPHCEQWREQPMKAIRSSFRKNEQLIRKDSDIMAIVIISDSEEAAGLDEVEVTMPDHVISDFNDRYDHELLVYGITIHPDVEGGKECQEQYGKGLLNPDENKYAVHIGELIKKTNGTNFNLCLENFVPLANKIVHDADNQWQRL